uniref:Heat stress transcription factor A-3 n=1 Tax=Nelumbo nucifera TaxID=4432 RepID=A0A822Y460_NELNU|nr:TPA_asm: hypothetical protein HUJ06_030182 [Nelumbo nucifera]
MSSVVLMVSCIRNSLPTCSALLRFNVLSQGFRKVDTDRWEFANEDFLRGKRHLLKNIHRRKSNQTHQIGSYSGLTTETEKLGLEKEVERLRREKNFLMQEVIKLQQEQHGTADQVETMNQRLQAAEQRQKQMVTFLAKVLQNPTLLTHLQKKAEHRGIASPRVKRKFIKQHHLDQRKLDPSMEGQIVKYNTVEDNLNTSSVMEKLDPVSGTQLPGYILQDMVGKLGLGAASIHIETENVASSEMQQELVGASSQMEVGTLDLGTLGSEVALLKGKNVMSLQEEGSADYFVSFPEGLAKDKTLPDFMSPGTESISKQDDIWSMGFDASANVSSLCPDMWDNAINYDAQDLGIMGGISDPWDLSSLQAAGGGTDNSQNRGT